MMDSGDKASSAPAASNCPACRGQCPWWHWISFNGRGEPPRCPAFKDFDPPDHKHGTWMGLLDEVEVRELVLDLPAGLDLGNFEEVTVRLWAEIEWSETDRRWRAGVAVIMSEEEKDCVESCVTVGDFLDAQTALEQSKRTSGALHRKIDRHLKVALRRAVKRYERVQRDLDASEARLQAWVKSLNTQEKP